MPDASPDLNKASSRAKAAAVASARSPSLGATSAEAATEARRYHSASVAAAADRRDATQDAAAETDLRLHPYPCCVMGCGASAPQHSSYARTAVLPDDAGLKKQDPSLHAQAVHYVTDHFPGAMSDQAWLDKVNQVAGQHGFVPANTLPVVGTCRDELCRSLKNMIESHWGHPFDISALAGLVMCGKTALGAAAAHAPEEDGQHRYLFLVMPHISVNEAGQVGLVHREGIQRDTGACGSLGALLKELQADAARTNASHSKRSDAKAAQGNSNDDLLDDDLEQSVVRRKIKSVMPNHLLSPTLIDLTQAALVSIEKDLRQLLQLSLRSTKECPVEYIVVTGIEVHAAIGCDFIAPGPCWHVRNGKESKLRIY